MLSDVVLFWKLTKSFFHSISFFCHHHGLGARAAIFLQGFRLSNILYLSLSVLSVIVICVSGRITKLFVWIHFSGFLWIRWSSMDKNIIYTEEVREGYGNFGGLTRLILLIFLPAAVQRCQLKDWGNPEVDNRCGAIYLRWKIFLAQNKSLTSST